MKRSYLMLLQKYNLLQLEKIRKLESKGIDLISYASKNNLLVDEMLKLIDNDTFEMNDLQLDVSAYLIKPIKLEILVLRIKQFLCESPTIKSFISEYILGSLVINKITLEVYLNNAKIDMRTAKILR
jgi:DNA-binding response OmpR family regulator